MSAARCELVCEMRDRFRCVSGSFAGGVMCYCF